MAVAILLLGMAPPVQGLGTLPSTVYLLAGQKGSLSLPAGPLFQARVDQEEFLHLGDEPLSTRWTSLKEGALWASAPGKGRLEVAFLGLVPVATLQVEARPALALAPGGEALGVLLRGTGVTVVDETALRGADGVARRPAFEAGVRPGDRLVAVEGVPVERKEDAAARIRAAIQKGAPVVLELERGGRSFTVEVPPVYDVRAQRYLIGLWIRDGASGVGTLTFVDPR
ncbi:MAG: PDZ domain-containing protein, partial [Bacillota bacterium]|nr:PDZ domain-containing protein [Bacillota bacterium]